jgi:hypothetical protein
MNEVITRVHGIYKTAKESTWKLFQFTNLTRKLLRTLALSAMLATAFAQRSVIGAPADGITVHPGSNISRSTGI